MGESGWNNCAPRGDIPTKMPAIMPTSGGFAICAIVTSVSLALFGINMLPYITVRLKGFSQLDRGNGLIFVSRLPTSVCIMQQLC